MEIWGLLLTPSDAPANRPLPTLVYIHGGPGGGFTYGLFPQFMHIVPQVDPYPTATLAGAGYAILMPMPRGGAGYGEAGQRAIVNGWGDADYKDIMTGVDALIAQGIADPNRLGVMGASYGGFMTNWIVTQTGRFKAASAGASLSDLSDTYYLSEGGVFMADYFKRPWENRDGYAGAFAADLCRQGDDAAADPARRGRPARADRQRVEVLQDAEVDGQDRGAGNLSARWTRAARADATAHPDAAQPRVVHEMDQRKVSSAAASPCSPQME